MRAIILSTIHGETKRVLYKKPFRGRSWSLTAYALQIPEIGNPSIAAYGKRHLLIGWLYAFCIVLIIAKFLSTKKVIADAMPSAMARQSEGCIFFDRIWEKRDHVIEANGQLENMFVILYQLSKCLMCYFFDSLRFECLWLTFTNVNVPCVTMFFFLYSGFATFGLSRLSCAFALFVSGNQPDRQCCWH